MRRVRKNADVYIRLCCCTWSLNKRVELLHHLIGIVNEFRNEL